MMATTDVECQLCGKYFGNDLFLKDHVRLNHHKGSEVQCSGRFSNGDLCCEKFTQAHSLKIHVTTFHSKKLCDHKKCLSKSISDKTFDDKLALDIHQNEIHGALLHCKFRYRHGKRCRASFSCYTDKVAHELTCLEPQNSKTELGPDQAFSGNSTSWKDGLMEFPIASPKNLEDPTMSKLLTYESGGIQIKYDYNLKGLKWVRQTFHKDHPFHITVHRSGNRTIETHVPIRYRRDLKEFIKEGFDAGHMAPHNINSHNRTIIMELNRLSNYALQLKSLNCGLWKRIEEEEESFVKYHLKTYSYVLPVYTGENEGEKSTPDMPIASHFARVLLGQISFSGELEMKIFLVPHKFISKNTPVIDFYVTLQKLEELVGINFFPNLDERKIEWLNGNFIEPTLEKATAMSNDDVFAQPLLPPPPSASLKSATHSTSRSSSSGEKKAESSPSTIHSSSSSSSTSSGHSEKVSAETREKCNAFLSSHNYQPPKNAASCADPRYNLEVLKNGTIVDSVKFSRHENKGYYLIGRDPGCDIVAENPTVSRVHAILQFVQFSGQKEEGDKKSEEMVDEPEETGLYLYDLKSTNGTFINKHQVSPEKFYPVRVGHVLQFGTFGISILNGPSEDEEEESDKSVTELLNEKLGKDLERKRLEEEAQLKRENSKLPKENIEEEGIDWGMGEDADAESDMRVNPFAMDYDASELTLDNPKKTLKSWFEREGHDLEYEVREKENGQCRSGLSLGGPTDAPVYAESEVKGKKKEAAHDAAMKACQILDSHGILRSSNQESKKRKEQPLEDDDVVYLGQKGSFEKKREKKMRL